MKKIQTYLITILLCLASVFVIIPNLNNGPIALYKSEKYYKSSELIETKFFLRPDKKRLIITMTDGSTYGIGNSRSKHFDVLSSASNVGKKFTLYTPDETNDSPRRLEIENKVIYEANDDTFWSYFILLATPLFVYFSILEFKKKKKRIEE